ncbi:long-chain-fatty-acid--CoA ligase ACSBG2-like isoform X2 [Ochotona princeps]|uniref:long-chain-fatty-acid--CoA ligase ACSBG2-like isoform X2 n=1 Tax=Ochotona princeps TaxID=9978 RepID=UPI002714B3E1|nr:long-chain-fatty-acid--CoA ligase ACSBG2-like isoform X2 [Ochotona princeps]
MARPSSHDTAHSEETEGGGFDYWTTQHDGEVRLRQDRNLRESEAPLTVHDLVMGTAVKYSHYVALGSKHRSGWHLLTYIEYYEECRRAAKAFLRLGLERFHSVGIMGLNSQEWVIASIGAIMAGGFSVGLLSTNSPRVCRLIAQKSKMDIFVVDSDRQLQKVTQIRGSLKHLKAIVQYQEEIRREQRGLYSWQRFLELAKAVSDAQLDQVIDSQKPNQCCTLVHRPGAAGRPKLAMLSHDNITWTTAATVQSLCFRRPPEGQEVLLCYLPLSCFRAQLFHVWVAVAVAGALYFAQPEAALRGSLVDLLREVQPTSFYGVPWVWEQLLDALKARQLDASAFRQKVDAWARSVGLRDNRRPGFRQVHPSLCFRLAKLLTFDSARRFLGLGSCRQFLSSGLRLPRLTFNFFLSLNIPILELYGLAEASGVHSLCTQNNFQLQSCGKAIPGAHTKVVDEDAQGEGRVCVWGRNVFMGYLDDKESTQQWMDAQGWLRTDDLGFLDMNNFLSVTGNIKDVIKLQSGESINPHPIEDRVKLGLPIARHVVVVGQGAPFLCALLTLKCQINPETGEPRHMLTSEAVAFCRKLHSQSTRLLDIVYGHDPAVLEAVSLAIEAANASAPSNGARIVKWCILDKDFSVAGGELGATLKLRRAVVAKMYQVEMRRFYEDHQEG